MLIDIADVIFSGGHGGAGITSFGKMAHSGPDGGNGGKGGNIYLTAKSDITLLNQFSREVLFAAENGYPGGKNKRTGRDGRDLEIFVPVGTVVIDKFTKKEILEFAMVDQKELISKGGLGGRGNYEFRSSTNTTPKRSDPGRPGERKELILNLKLIADYGLIGLPNAGKTSLLNELTRANAKTAGYPFTTLEPNLGVFKGKIIADIPGLIEGASVGRGLGISFLKHIEKVKTILHCISVDSENPLNDYKIVRRELIKYGESLGKKNEIILLTKSDLIQPKALQNISRKLKKYSKNILAVSIYDWAGIEKLKKFLTR